MELLVCSFVRCVQHWYISSIESLSLIGIDNVDVLTKQHKVPLINYHELWYFFWNPSYLWNENESD